MAINLEQFKKLCLETPEEKVSGWIVSNKCRFCEKEISGETFDTGFTYWRALLFGCHKDCLEGGLRQEVIECQTIDADCNDCKHFLRKKMVQKGASSIWEGECLKLNKKTRAFPKFCSGHKCFVHRKSNDKQPR